MANRLLGIWIFLAFVYAGQFIADGTMALARAGSIKHILPTNPIFVFVIVIVLFVSEFALAKIESKGGYQE